VTLLQFSPATDKVKPELYDTALVFDYLPKHPVSAISIQRTLAAIFSLDCRILLHWIRIAQDRTPSQAR